MAALLSEPAAAVLRWISLCAASLLMGVATYHRVRDRAAAGVTPTGGSRLAALVRGAAIALVLAAIGRMAQQSLTFAAAPPEAWEMVRVLLATPWGWAWAGQVLAAMLLVTRPGTIAVPGQTGAQVLVVLVIVAAPAFQGHAIGSPRLTWLAVAADIAHLAAAGAWMGTLLVIAIDTLPVRDGASAAAVIRAFSPLALTSAAILTATGLLASWLHVQELTFLWGSTYGRVLCLKLALVVAVVAVGAVNWRRLTPRILEPGGVGRLAAAARAELTIAAAVFAVTAVLVATALPGE